MLAKMELSRSARVESRDQIPNTERQRPREEVELTLFEVVDWQVVFDHVLLPCMLCAFLDLSPDPLELLLHLPPSLLAPEPQLFLYLLVPPRFWTVFIVLRDGYGLLVPLY